MEPQLMGTFLQAGVAGAVLWWLTFKLIPQLQKERSEAISAFQTEQEKERLIHREAINRIITVHEKAVDGLLEHMKLDHAIIK